MFDSHASSVKKSFTLIELLVVISIIGLLASIVFTSLASARQKGRVAAGAQFHSHTYHAVGAYASLAYVFDDQQAGSATDSSGNNQIATFGGAPSYSTDVPISSSGARSIYLNGASYLTAPDSATLRLTTYTVSVWIKPNGAPSEWVGIIGKPGRNFNIWLHPAGFIHHRFHNSGSTNAGAPDTPTGSVTFNEWNEVTITNDGTTVRTFINGELKASGSSGGVQIVDNTALYIGRNLDGGASNYFNGWIDDIFISSEPMSISQVQKQYAQARAQHTHLASADTHHARKGEHGVE